VSSTVTRVKVATVWFRRSNYRDEIVIWSAQFEAFAAPP
jgi:hypothetical protein